MRIWTDRLAEQLLDWADVVPQPPIDVELLARRLGVSEILEAEIVEDGRLHVGNGTTTIYVRRDDVTPQRRRFTVAHELGHLALGRLDEKGTARRQTSTDEERLCDQIAAAILMPAGWIVRHFDGRRPCLSTLRQLRDDCDVSMSAALVRCRELLRWRQSLLRWSFDGTRWRFRGGAGIPAPIHHYVQSAPATSETLTRLRDPSIDQEAEVPLKVRGREVVVPGEYSIGATHALGLVRFRWPSR